MAVVTPVGTSAGKGKSKLPAFGHQWLWLFTILKPPIKPNPNLSLGGKSSSRLRDETEVGSLHLIYKEWAGFATKKTPLSRNQVLGKCELFYSFHKGMTQVAFLATIRRKELHAGLGSHFKTQVQS